MGEKTVSKRKVKCPYCDTFFSRQEEEYVLIKNRYWHKACYEKYKEENAKSILAIEELEKYICKLFGTEFVSPRIKKQIKSMVENYHFTYTGILKTLQYHYEVKEGSLKKSNDGIGIVPYVYDSARKYYETLFYSQQLNEKFDINELKLKPKKITILSPRAEKKIEQIDLSFLENGDDDNDKK